jgi:hypothetical protein
LLLRKTILSVEQGNEEIVKMDIWTMIVLVVAICVAGDIIKSRRNKEISESKTSEDLSGLLGRLKSRVENLETIVIEKEKTRRFEEL